MKENVIAIVPAAGSGKRFSSKTNKAFHNILGKPVIAWVLEVFQECRLINEIIPVFSEEDMERGLELIENRAFSKVKKIAPGGNERQDSVYHALKLIEDVSSTVLIHDGARPAIDFDIIRRCLDALDKFDGVVSGVPVKDTIKEVRKGVVRKTLDRNKLIAVQTPQAFRFKTLMQAYENIKGKGICFTDDAAVVEFSGGMVTFVDGSFSNIKVTTPDDAEIVEIFLKSFRGKNGE
ncbi:2-C-methyl-D-erythritol 4-phosphate cytidylyltransferase [bacterium BMS3Abin07]|nr:2-C-methyl-D-erythritol 4-phosphate cytidylyltransferase [bacterium BMS3Abin07]GBE33086.1 2-C-methyl-D-erythritol 4-phosphate cytidylyltransferase [bacterium BMS3Bbin05]